MRHMAKRALSLLLALLLCITLFPAAALAEEGSIRPVCNTKMMCQRLCDDLQRRGLHADCLHGNIPQSQREKTMHSFRRGELPVLIATDVASRGIDVDDVDAVFNFEVPEENEYYIHRIGRTGRAKKHGVAYTLLGDFPSRMRLDTIVRNTRSHVIRAELDEAGHVRPIEEK